MTRSLTKELFTPFKDPKQEFRSSRKHFKTLSLDESRSPDFDLFSDQEECSKEEVAETMAKNMEQYTRKTQTNYGSGVERPKIKDKHNSELKGQFLKELHTNTFSNSDHKDANEHIKNVLEIVDLFHIPNITIDQVMLRAFPMSLTGAASHWPRNKPSGCEQSKCTHYTKDCPFKEEGKTLEEAYYTQFDRTEKYPKGVVENMLVGIGKFVFPVDFIVLDMPKDIKVPLILGRPFFSTAHTKIDVFKTKNYFKGCEQSKCTHYTKDCPFKEEGKTLEEAYYTQFVLEDMDAYRDEEMGDVIFGEPFLREVRINARQFEGMITIYNSNE
nr:hypothetical protein [Tanacetum cinerariifolium]